MSRLLNPLVRNSFLPLRDAVLCTECEFISANSTETCPVCGSTSLLQLNDLVKSHDGSPTLDTVHAFRFQVLRLGGEIS
jgi:hypothetical protein